MKANAEKLNMAHAGVGSIAFSCGLLLNSILGVKPIMVPFTGVAAAMNALIGGQVDYMFDSISSAMPHIQSGKLRAIAVTTAKRSSALPNVPTIAEAGLPGYELSPWFAVYMPAGTPKPIVDKINAALLDAMKLPEVKARFAAIGAEAIASTPEQLATHLESEMAKWGKIIQSRGIRAD